MKKKKIIPIIITLIAIIIAAVGIKAALPSAKYKDNHIVVRNSQLEWNLVLVNPWNELPDNMKCKEMELRNGSIIDRRIYEDLQNMFDDARYAGFDPEVTSGYRSRKKQQQLFDDKKKEFKNQGYSNRKAEEAALQWVAEPGYSEHETGFAVDINEIGGNSQSLYKWLEQNCSKYGFILRYPAEKTDITGIEYEPWHFRYVGHDAAEYITANGLTLEEYLEKTL